MNIFFILSIFASFILNKIFASSLFPSLIENNFEMKSLLDWNITKYKFKDKDKDKDNFQDCTLCIPEKIKSLNDSIFFVSFPRRNKSADITFAKFNKSNNYFEPFPNFNSNSISCDNKSENNTCLVSVTAFEIDKNGKIYILDNEGMLDNRVSIKLKIFSKQGELLNKPLLNETIIDNTTYLNDIVIDIVNNYSYIADSNFEFKENRKESINPRILGLNLTTSNLIVILEKDNSLKADNTYWYHLNDTPVYNNTPMKVGVSGLALSCDGKTLFYSSLSSRKFYSFETSTRNEINQTRNMYYSYKNEASIGLIFSNSKNLYMTGIESGAIYLANQIDYDLQRFDYKDLYKVDISENNSLAEYMDIFNGTIYFIRKKINYLINSDEGNNANYANFSINYFNISGDQSYRNGCPGVEKNFGIGNIIIWIIFLFVLCLVFVFVCVSRQQNEDKYDLIKSNK